MKILKILMLCLCLSGVVYLQSCKTENIKAEKVSITGKEYTSKYVCPMHCLGSGGEELGTCPVCKMDYELNEEYKEN